MHTPVEHRTDEPDIGSGEKTPGQHDTEKMIEQVPTTPFAPFALFPFSLPHHATLTALVTSRPRLTTASLAPDISVAATRHCAAIQIFGYPPSGERR